MTDEQLGVLLGAFANYYWSAPLTYVMNRIATWHPEVTKEQIEIVLNRCNEDLFWHHCCVIDEEMDEPELVAEQLVMFEDDLNLFLASRIDAPYYDCDEETLLNFEEKLMETPEAKAIIRFGKTSLGVDDEWARQLVQDCIFCQPTALYEEESWVFGVLEQEEMGYIQFQTVDQVKRFRNLGNRFYRIMPNPVLKGWKPSEIENAPVLMDDIPERDEDIPSRRELRNEVHAQNSGRGMEMQQAVVKKVGPNDPCPCGSGKKYKKCCGRG